ncbi:MAG TPA: hypothetical protein VH107_07585 [Lacipirellulaceae bacterium]|jgi:hypothetical protein|nr:hypothetical protein [Lacipirellulaceae bacterium]
MVNSNQTASRLPSILQWTPSGRALVFVLSATSIWCLLAEMYHVLDMQSFFYTILLPSTVALYGIALLDRSRGDGRLWRAVVIGTSGGLVGAVAYDIFRLPFVYSDAWGLGRFGIPQMPLFKVFPRFGAMLLGQPIEQASYSLAANLFGWAYHFSNGATFGVMFVAMYAGAREAYGQVRGNPGWAIFWAMLLAAGIEACLLVSPYAAFFGIAITPRFVVVTLTAHLIFGVGLGVYYAWHVSRWRLTAPAAA